MSDAQQDPEAAVETPSPAGGLTTDSPPRLRKPRSARANALWTLVFAALTLGSLALPWVGYSSSREAAISGFDLMKLSEGVASDTNNAVSLLQVLTALSIGLIALSLLRMMVPGGTSWLALLGALALFGIAVWTTVRINTALNDGGIFAPGMQAGPIVASVAAGLCAITACRGPGALRSQRQIQ
jgi:hypothetical protein